MWTNKQNKKTKKQDGLKSCCAAKYSCCYINFLLNFWRTACHSIVLITDLNVVIVDWYQTSFCFPSLDQQSEDKVDFLPGFPRTIPLPGVSSCYTLQIELHTLQMQHRPQRSNPEIFYKVKKQFNENEEWEKYRGQHYRNVWSIWAPEIQSGAAAVSWSVRPVQH